MCIAPCKGNRTGYKGRAFLGSTSWCDQAARLPGCSHLQQTMQRLTFISASIPASLAFQSQLDFSSCFLSLRHAHTYTNAPPQAAVKFKLSWVGTASCKALGTQGQRELQKFRGLIPYARICEGSIPGLLAPPALETALLNSHRHCGGKKQDE